MVTLDITWVAVVQPTGARNLFPLPFSSPSSSVTILRSLFNLCLNITQTPFLLFYKFPATGVFYMGNKRLMTF